VISIGELSDRNFKATDIKKLNELEEIVGKCFTSSTEKLNKEIEANQQMEATLKKNQTEILKLKNILSKIKKNLEAITLE
jgi:hypothetical protein